MSSNAKVQVPKYSINKFKSKQNQTALLIPIINEGKRILLQLERIIAIKPEVDIIIADGGSTDDTLKNIIESQIQITSFLRKEDKGKLSAQLRLGFDYCIKEKYEYVITMDGNNKDGENGIKTIQDALNSGFDFVQGSRFIRGGEALNTPLIRTLAIKLIHAPITSLAARRRFTDSTNGFRGFRIGILKNNEINVFRSIFDSYEMLFYLPIQIARAGFNVCEVPVKREYPIGVKTPTKISGLGSHFKLMKFLIFAAFGLYKPR